MKKLKIVLGIIFFLGATFYYYTELEISKGNAHVKCMYMHYACGDCYPQYKVLTVDSGDIKWLHTDFELRFKSKEEQRSFEKLVDDLSQRDTIDGEVYVSDRNLMYDLKGTVYYSPWKGWHVFDVEDYHIFFKKIPE